MTRRLLTTMGSATAVTAVVGGCLLLGPAPQAQAGTICNPPTSTTNCVTFGPKSISATSGKSTGTVTFTPTGICATGSTVDSSGMVIMKMMGSGC